MEVGSCQSIDKTYSEICGDERVVSDKEFVGVSPPITNGRLTLRNVCIEAGTADIPNFLRMPFFKALLVYCGETPCYDWVGLADRDSPAWMQVCNIYIENVIDNLVGAMSCTSKKTTDKELSRTTDRLSDAKFKSSIVKMLHGIYNYDMCGNASSDEIQRICNVTGGLVVKLYDAKQTVKPEWCLRSTILGKAVVTRCKHLLETTSCPTIWKKPIVIPSAWIDMFRSGAPDKDDGFDYEDDWISVSPDVIPVHVDAANSA